MTQHKLLIALVTTIGLISVALTCDAGESKKSDSKVKATATASKVNDKGEQVVTITLKIEDGWHLYANPVNHNNEFLDPARTKVIVEAKGKPIKADVKYPLGKTKVEGKDTFDVFVGEVKIEAVVNRVAAGPGPLNIIVEVSACTKRLCLDKGEVKLTIP